MRKSQLQSRSIITDKEYQSFSEKFVDGLLDPGQPWLIEYALAGGFNKVPDEEYIDSGRFAWGMRDAIEHGWLADEWMVEAFRKPDKQKLVLWLKKNAKAAKLTRDHMARLLECTKSKTLRRSLKGLGTGFLFSLMSVFNIGFREFNLGQWIRMLQPREFDIRARGWMRVLSGVQSLLGVALVALSLLSYIGQPFD